MSEWIKCSERLPDDDTYVVAARHYGYDITPDAYVSWFMHGTFHVCTDGLEASNYDGGACIGSTITVTHWLPIPPITEQE